MCPSCFVPVCCMGYQSCLQAPRRPTTSRSAPALLAHAPSSARALGDASWTSISRSISNRTTSSAPLSAYSPTLAASSCSSSTAPACSARADVLGGHNDARQALRACLDASWTITRAVVNRAFLPSQRGGRIVYLAPAHDAGDHADAARAGLENLARTLSIEWARHGITTVAIAPGTGMVAGASTTASTATSARREVMVSQVAALTAYLASAAGAYFSGCLLDLSGGLCPATDSV